MSLVGQNDPYRAPEAFDPTAMLDRIGGDTRLFVELVEIFLEESPLLLDEIRLAIAENDANRLKHAAHTLRGAIGNFTVGGPYEIARQLESMARTNDLTTTRSALDSLTDGVEQLARALRRCVACSVS